MTHVCILTEVASSDVAVILTTFPENQENKR